MIRSRRSITGALVGLALAAMLLPGCIGLRGPNDIKRKIARQSDTTIKQEFGIRTNGLTLKLARGIAQPFVDEKLPRMKGIKNVQFGSYNIEPYGSAPTDLRLRDLEIKGYDPVVTISAPKRGEEIRVFAKERNERLRGIIVANREGNELMLARVRGNLEKFLVNLMEDGIMGNDIDLGIFDNLDRPRDDAPAVRVVAPEETVGETVEISVRSADGSGFTMPVMVP